MRGQGILLVLAGGALGSVLRYVLGTWIAARLPHPFPWHTFFVNLSGAFLVGVLVGLTPHADPHSHTWRLLIGAGFLGGFTTFSTLAVESVALFDRGLVAQGALNMFGSGVLGLAVAALGIVAGRALR